MVGDSLSQSRFREILARYQQSRLARYRQVYYAQPGWISLTRKGVRRAGLDYEVDPPSDRSLEHLYWINEVRLHLEEQYPRMRWISERAIRATQGKRVKGEEGPHIPDGILILSHSNGTQTHIDIEVQVSTPSYKEVEEVMRGSWTNNIKNPVWYFVTRASQRVVRSVHRTMQKQMQPLRASIQITDLKVWITSYKK